MAAVSLWTPLDNPRIAARWFTLPNILVLWPVPLLTALTAFAAWRALDRGRDIIPFAASVALFLLGYLGLAISTFPYLVPFSLTIWQAAAAPSSQLFMLIGTVVLLPLTFAYTAYVYWLFRAKVKPGETYHH
jgi:cytochrome d ubiquinol oxidase subunit II